jgi:hypothetical protein
MTRITADAELQAKLSGLASEVEVCDEAGKTLGVFFPAEWHHQLLYAYARSQVSNEELDQARQETGGRSLRDILSDLERS